ncbi:MocR-like pyridoxine biosynthesis transcription factor PdxR [Flavisphingomonas formosensis]|uniref:MocR-like pyridoxine biosynthesis transcription factor PdxR n=1 Tax=Flavisphingomonas formosensis TaxID=861534 RepID=UPI0018E04B33|nr:PLP-dependent aminotransferase family protein [Sphingomonas formosensis]
MSMNLIISIDRNDERSLQVQLYEALRDQILKGSLPAGKRLPSTRSMSSQLGIARNTVVLAYERLAAEDYITSRAKAGIFVNDRLPDATVLLRNGHSAAPPVRKRVRLGRNPSFTGRSPQLWHEKRARPQFDFFVGRPHPAGFPTSFWQRAIAKHLAYARGAQTEYGDPRGLSTLREAIAAHLADTRGISPGADQIMITSGIQGALNLLARIFLTGAPKASVAVENPCYQGAAYLFGSYGASIRPIDVDEQGIVVSQLEGFMGNLVYVTPSHQFPTGSTLSLDRRLHLLDWAYQTGSYVIEDDYDSDFRYDGPPLTALAGLDRNGHVIYLGTFSKSIGAGLRIGYAVLPRHLLDQARIVKSLTDNGAPWLEQAVIADFLNEGAFLRHLRRIRRSYMAARDAVVEAVERHFPGGALLGQECGMHMMWTLPPDLPSADEMQRLAKNCGVGLYPFQGAAVHEYGNPGRFRARSLVLGYTGLDKNDIREAFSRVADLLARSA